MNKLAQWLDLGHYLREPAHLAAGFVATALLASTLWTGWSSVGVDPISGSRGNRLILSTLNTEQLMDRPTRLTELAALEQRSASAPMPVRAMGDTARRLEQERRCLATGVYFEARGESYPGQMAVADVIMNRVASKDYPNTICGVVFQGSYRQTGCQFSFTCDGESDRPRDLQAWRKAQRLASIITMGVARERLVAENVTHYHADYVEPFWAAHLHKVAKIGRHIFYSRTRSAS
ncbi:MAG: cell wall hydrolase [Parvibaculaceae bacterium]